MVKPSAPETSLDANVGGQSAVPTRMQALLKSTPGPGAELADVPLPEIGPDDVLVKVLAASICGTDLHIFDWDGWAQRRIHPPLVFGHEFCGEVVAVGPEVTRVFAGDYVAAESHIACGECHECRRGQAHVCRRVQIVGVDRPGAFAEYVAIPERNAWLTDRRFPPEIATIQEPMGNAVHAALSAPIAGANVAIFGAGPIGLFAVPIARASGAARVITVEPSSYRRELALRMGSNVVVDPVAENVAHRILEETSGEGADVLLEMSGNPQALAQGFKALRYGGHASLLGIPSQPVELDLADGVIFKGATVQGITGRLVFQTWFQTRGFLESGMDLTAAITHRVPLTDFAGAFELVRTARSGKVVMFPSGRAEPGWEA
jgi:threonine 3-dehydrogenase